MKKMDKNSHSSGGLWQKQVRVMKLCFILTFIGIMHLSAATYSQDTRLDLKVKNASLESVMNNIRAQSEYSFFFDDVAVEASDADANQQAEGRPQGNAARCVVHLRNGNAVRDTDDTADRQVKTACQKDKCLADRDQNERKSRIAFVGKITGAERIAVQTAHDRNDQDQHDIRDQRDPVICQLFAQ